MQQITDDEQTGTWHAPAIGKDWEKAADAVLADLHDRLGPNAIKDWSDWDEVWSYIHEGSVSPDELGKVVKPVEFLTICASNHRKGFDNLALALCVGLRHRDYDQNHFYVDPKTNQPFGEDLLMSYE